MGLANNLRVWGSLIISTAGLCLGYLYISSDSNFVVNPNPVVPQPDGKFKWNPFTYSATAVFLMVLVPFTMYGLYFYISRPWKQKIYKNIYLFVIFLLNVGGTIAQFFILKH